jgi:malate dehydrogenase (oxaloacetate-decarboxylating)(NADP+)
MNNIKDLSLAYSPGVAEPCIEIAENPDTAYKYTSKGNMVAVISNGTAVLGLGNIGALASKPVMEGKAVLLNKFAGVEAVDICIDAQEREEFVEVVKSMSPSFGAICLEDLRSPDCFYIEKELKKEMNIPVFHDDQHSTAIVVLAGLINALHYSGKKKDEVRIVINGAGSSGQAVGRLIVDYGFDPQNLLMCDTRGVIYEGREEGRSNPYKARFAMKTEKRTLEDAVKGADILIGLSQQGAFTGEMLKSMNKDPVVFALANPEPEIRPEQMYEVREDVIAATGRSDYPNMIGCTIAFPFLFRAALDTRSSEINEAMKMACAKSLSELARSKVPDVVKRAYNGV